MYITHIKIGQPVAQVVSAGQPQATAEPGPAPQRSLVRSISGPASSLRSFAPDQAGNRAGDVTRVAALANWQQQAEVLRRTREAVEQKLNAAQSQRATRARAAAVLLRDGHQDNLELPHDDMMNIARRRAFAKWVLARERLEVRLLADERDALQLAGPVTLAASAAAQEMKLPTGLLWPATGVIARRFAVFIHPRSAAALSRRGIDIEVQEHVGTGAAANGTVLFAGPIRGLDSGVIIDHGSYVTVTAKLGKVTVVAGDLIEAGTTIGNAESSRIYFEVRVKIGPEGTPVDPLACLR
jgi:septal ring factor EnvC (AmiA/AmiB activator)